MTAEPMGASIQERLYPRLFAVHAAVPALRERGALSFSSLPTLRDIPPSASPSSVQ